MLRPHRSTDLVKESMGNNNHIVPGFGNFRRTIYGTESAYMAIVPSGQYG
jgi:hypothetical protein